MRLPRLKPCRCVLDCVKWNVRRIMMIDLDEIQDIFSAIATASPDVQYVVRVDQHIDHSNPHDGCLLYVLISATPLALDRV